MRRDSIRILERRRAHRLRTTGLPRLGLIEKHATGGHPCPGCGTRLHEGFEGVGAARTFDTHVTCRHRKPCGWRGLTS